MYGDMLRETQLKMQDFSTYLCDVLIFQKVLFTLFKKKKTFQVLIKKTRDKETIRTPQ